MVLNGGGVTAPVRAVAGPVGEDAGAGLLEPLWRLVPLSGIDVPRVGAVQGLQRSFFEHLQRWRAVDAAEAESEPSDDLLALDTEVLQRMTPAFDGAQLVDAFDEAFNAGMRDTAAHDERHQWMVAMPHSGAVEGLLAWAVARGYRLVEAPSGGVAFDDVPMLPADRPFVIAHLERWLVRDVQGLRGLRQLFDALMRCEQPWVVCCDSWAWEFIAHVLPVEDLCPLTLAPLDARALSNWLGRGEAFDGSGPWRFLNEGVKQLAQAGEDEPTEGAKSYFRELAARSHGLALCALAGWRASLSWHPQESSDRTHMPLEGVIWVRGLASVGWPKPVPALSLDDRLVLHAVALHGGCHEATLSRVLSIESLQLSGILRRMREAALLVCVDGWWVTRAPTYPAVLRDLHVEGFLTDATMLP